ncbi:MAG: hypothetical protein Q7K44_01690 [Candidatus Liptonbacteria bacterium]|nr:hypothetical protein [Candidatus Liptonbacteria bacterium]
MTKSEGGAPEHTELQEIPQLNTSTGLSMDYRNEYTFLIGYLSLGMDEVRNALREMKYTMKRYEERFPPETYKDVVSERNKDAVKRINELADYLNTKFQAPESLSEEELLSKYKELEMLIGGSN